LGLLGGGPLCPRPGYCFRQIELLFRVLQLPLSELIAVNVPVFAILRHGLSS